MLALLAVVPLAVGCQPTESTSVPAVTVPGEVSPTIVVTATTGSGPASAAAAASVTPTTRPLGIYVVGDSLTSGPDEAMPVGGDYPADCWVGYLGDRVRLTGGWAAPGATTYDMWTSVAAAPDTDVLVIMAGENDWDTGTDVDQLRRNLAAIVQVVQGDRVLIVGATPTDYDLPTSGNLNAVLRQFAQDQAYGYVDGGTGLRDDAGAWLPGMTTDGTHPTPAAAKVIATTVYQALAAMAAGELPG